MKKFWEQAARNSDATVCRCSFCYAHEPLWRVARTKKRIGKERQFMPMHASTTFDREQALSILRAAKNRLEYLTPNDWSLLVDKGMPAHFKQGECLIRQGEKTSSVFPLLSGAATIQVYATRIAQIGAGEICGEMAFLEKSLPSATVTAEQPLQALMVEWDALSDVFELFPHLGSRFYRSLAVNLSRRLREQIIFKQGEKK